MSRGKSVALLLLLVVLFSVAAGAGAQRPRRGRPRSTPRPAPTQPGAAAAQVESAGDQTFAVGCRTYCSDEVTPPTGDTPDTRPRRTAVAEITWRVTNAQLQPQDLVSSTSQQAIEVTVYKDGFSRQRFASLFSVREGQSFSMEGNQDVATRIPGLDRLTIRDVRPVRDRNTTNLTFDGPSNLVAVEVEGLEAGLNYYWRVAVPSGANKVTSEVVRCQAPTCPIDFQPRAAQ